ncbi:hypothetical protein BJ912DRAFT_1148142 [Pholiota molesta]|nr:hypothetical protein BJ912DRAFT_1148142 [Pholiota molesta]
MMRADDSAVVVGDGSAGSGSFSAAARCHRLLLATLPLHHPTKRSRITLQPRESCSLDMTSPSIAKRWFHCVRASTPSPSRVSPPSSTTTPSAPSQPPVNRSYHVLLHLSHLPLDRGLDVGPPYAVTGSLSGLVTLSPPFVHHIPISLLFHPQPMWPFPTAASSQRTIGHHERPLSSRVSSIKHHTAICPFPIASPASPARRPPPSARLRTEPIAQSVVQTAARGALRFLSQSVTLGSGNSLHAHQPSSPPTLFIAVLCVLFIATGAPTPSHKTDYQRPAARRTPVQPHPV